MLLIGRQVNGWASIRGEPANRLGTGGTSLVWTEAPAEAIGVVKASRRRGDNMKSPGDTTTMKLPVLGITAVAVAALLGGTAIAQDQTPPPASTMQPTPDQSAPPAAAPAPMAAPTSDQPPPEATMQPVPNPSGPSHEGMEHHGMRGHHMRGHHHMKGHHHARGHHAQKSAAAH